MGLVLTAFHSVVLLCVFLASAFPTNSMPKFVMKRLQDSSLISLWSNYWDAPTNPDPQNFEKLASADTKSHGSEELPLYEIHRSRLVRRTSDTGNAASQTIQGNVGSPANTDRLESYAEPPRVEPPASQRARLEEPDRSISSKLLVREKAKRVLGVVRSNLGKSIMQIDRSRQAVQNKQSAQQAILLTGEEESVRQALSRTPGGSVRSRLEFTANERALSKKRHQEWLRRLTRSRLHMYLLDRERGKHAEIDDRLALAGIRPLHQPSQPKHPPHVVITPKPAAVANRNPAHLNTFTQGWRLGQYRGAAPLGMLLTAERAGSAVVDDTNSHGRLRPLRNARSYEQFETESGSSRKLSIDDDPADTREKALGGARLRRGHTVSYWGEVGPNNFLSKAMRERQGLPPQRRS